uniref:JmjC domain-containing protein n=1 Tax=Gibberella zeae TaxID=5518 RepID=A0A4E9DM73_GIBZA
MSETLRSLHQKLDILVEKLAAIDKPPESFCPDPSNEVLLLLPRTKLQLHDATQYARSIRTGVAEALASQSCHVPASHHTPTDLQGLSIHTFESRPRRDKDIPTPPSTGHSTQSSDEGTTIETQATQSNNGSTVGAAQCQPSQHEGTAINCATSHKPYSKTATSTPSFRLTAEEMGEALVENLGKIITQDGFGNEILVPGPSIDLETFKNNLIINETDCSMAVQRYKTDDTPEHQGACFIYKETRKGNFEWPDFSDQLQPPTVAEAEAWLNHVIRDPPQHTISHYVGHATNVAFEGRLNPGPAILGEPELEDIHTPYFHISADQSATRFHVEDLSCLHEESGHGLRSANQVLAGVKIWILIATHHTAKFREFVDKYWGLAPCGMAVSHRSLLISPVRLRREEIDFSIHVACPGTLIVTHPCQYHMVINKGPCFAQSINFRLPNESLLCDRQIRCDDDGLLLYAKQHNMRIFPSSQETSLPDRNVKSLKRSHPDAGLARKRQKNKQARCAMIVSRHRDESRANKHWLQLITESLHATGQIFTAPKLTTRRLPDEKAYRFACAITSCEAIKGFCTIIDAWNKHVQTLVPEPEPEADILPVVRRAKSVNVARENEILWRYISQHSQLHLRQEVDALKNGAYRLDKEMKDNICEAAKWSNENFGYHMKAGKDFLELSNGNEGILPFYSCFPKQAFRVVLGRKNWFNRQQIRDVEKLLDTDHARALFRHGKALQDAVEAKQTMACRWVGQDIDWNKLDQRQILAHLDVDGDVREM